MTNKIGPPDQGTLSGLNKRVDNAGQSGGAGDSRPAAGSTARSGDSNETVNLTAGGQLLSRLTESLASAPSVDSSKVAEVKAAISSGNYEIDSGAIADAMLRFERSVGE